TAPVTLPRGTQYHARRARLPPQSAASRQISEDSMSFTTLTFLVFLTLVFSAYWSIRSRSAQNVLLLVSSYCFYGWWDYRFCVLMLLTSLQDFAVGGWISRVQNPGG